jgi:hypothetical protein
VDSAPGDSGGIGITNGVITGVTSYGVTLALCNPFGVCNRTSDVNDDIDSSFGEFAGDTRVSKYSSFIDNVTGVSVVDDIPPDTLIDSMPTDPSNDDTPTFGFSGTDVGSGVDSFDCDLDGDGAFSDIDCTSPKMLGTLDEGSHTFQVRAIDIDGNVDPTPASYTWMVDSTALPSVIVSTIWPPEIHKGQTSFTVTITGSGFQEDASVTFVNGCGPSPSASTVSVEDTIIIADIATKLAGPPGSCIFNVRVTNTDSSTGVGPEFTVLP